MPEACLDDNRTERAGEILIERSRIPNRTTINRLVLDILSRRFPFFLSIAQNISGQWVVTYVLPSH